MRVIFSDRLIIERPRDHHSVLAVKTLPLYMKVGKKPITFDKKNPPKNSLCLILHNLPQTAEILIWVRLRVGPIKERKRWVSVSGMRLRVVCFTLVILFIITVSSHPPAAASQKWRVFGPDSSSFFHQLVVSNFSRETKCQSCSGGSERCGYYFPPGLKPSLRRQWVWTNKRCCRWNHATWAALPGCWTGCLLRLFTSLWSGSLCEGGRGIDLR